MEKDFFDVFPHLKVKKELEELLDMVFVTKVSMNPGRTHLRVYIESSRWIHKKNIFALEDEIDASKLEELLDDMNGFFDELSALSDDELRERMDVYLGEFEQHGTDNITVEM